jgi:hypothetical protein
MTENLKKSLHNYEGLEITFLVEDGEARVEFESNGQKYDLSNPDDVILFINGTHVAVEPTDTHHATAIIGDWEPYVGSKVSLMVRVDEYFEGWEVEA